MKRIGIIAVLVFGMSCSGITVGSVYAMGKPSCCNSMSDCAQGLKKMSCCLADNGSGSKGVLPQVERTVTAPLARAIITTLPLQLACGDNPPLDQDDEDSTDESSLYLTNSVFLI